MSVVAWKGETLGGPPGRVGTCRLRGAPSAPG